MSHVILKARDLHIIACVGAFPPGCVGDLAKIHARILFSVVEGNGVITLQCAISFEFIKTY
jgi:hypothetical protein